eukprot:1356558-Rhodomonas_salina.1
MGGRSLPRGAWPCFFLGYTFTYLIPAEERTTYEVITLSNTRVKQGDRKRQMEKSVEFRSGGRRVTLEPLCRVGHNK